MDAPNNNGINKGKEVIPNSSRDVSAMDPQRLRRLAKNRQYARTFRQKQKDNIQRLKRNKAAEKEKLEILNPQVDLLRGQAQALQNENAAIRHRINQMAMLSSIGNQEIERLKSEKEKFIWAAQIKRLTNFNN